MSEFLRGYKECALWTAEDAKGANFSQESLILMEHDCAEFQKQNTQLLEQYFDYGRSESDAGHDFWLTRNRHGSGFWDSGLPKKLGDSLTKAAHGFGEQDLITENGVIEAQ